MNTKPTKINITYWGPQKMPVVERATGHGIFHENLINFLAKEKDIDFSVEELCSFESSDARSMLTNATRAIVKLLSDCWRFLKVKSKVVIVAYPSVPLVPFTSNVKFLFAFACYLAWQIKTIFTNQILILVVADLPVEQSLCFNKMIQVNKKWYNCFEKYLFKSASRIVVLSKIFEHEIQTKHFLPDSHFLLYIRNDYLPNYRGQSNQKCYDLKGETKIFYAGDLRRDADKNNLIRVFDVIKRHPYACMYICGMGGEWILELNLGNVFYVGMLDYYDHDTLAGQCDFALIIYPNIGYYNWTTTSKYSAYVGNGLAILSSDAETVAKCITEDGIGKAVPMEQLPDELERWIKNPEVFKDYKNRAKELMLEFRAGKHIKQWFDEVKILAQRKK